MLAEVIEVVGVIAEIDEVGGAGYAGRMRVMGLDHRGGFYRSCGVVLRPGDYEDGIFRGALNGPFGKHLVLS